MQGKTIFGKVLRLFILTLPILLSPQAQAAGRQQLHGHVPAAVAQMSAGPRLDAKKHLWLAISLPWRNQDSLETLIKNLYDRSNPQYHHYLGTQQFTEQFGPTTQDYQAVQDFLRSNGLAVEAIHPNRLIVDVDGAVGDIEKAFNVELHSFTKPDGTTFYAPTSEPSLDLDVPILHIHGLDNFNPPHSLIKHRPDAGTGPVADNTGSGTGSCKGCYVGSDFRNAYANGVTLTGTGIVSAVLCLGAIVESDITTYESMFNLPNVPLTIVAIDGFNTTQVPNPPNGENSLDIEQQISMAPGLKSLMLYMGSQNADDNLNRYATDNIAKTISISYGWSPDTTINSIAEECAVQGQSVFMAAGDSGAYAGGLGGNAAEEAPYLTIVGGTDLTTNGAGGTWAQETAWVDGGGGVCNDYPIPSYQVGVSMTTNFGSTTQRNIPDVSMFANFGFLIYAGGTEDNNIGGTSGSTPLWAAFTALANQEAAILGEPSVGFLNPTAYKLLSGASYTEEFHDITSGNNGSSTQYPAVPGYDLATGLGSPNGQALINALAGLGVPTPTVTSTPAPPTPTPTASEPCPSWAVVGNASLGTAVTLTTAANGEVGAAWNKTCISLNQNFNLAFKAYFGAAAGADGMDFVLQNDPRGVSAIGEGGSDKGYSASGGGVSITPSVAFALETYSSDGTLQPQEDGNDTSTCQYVIAGICPYTFLSSVCNGAEHTYSVAWNATAQTLTLSVDGPTVMTYTRNLVSSVFGGNSCVYYGFTGATGGANNLQYVYGINCLTAISTPVPPTATRTSTSTSTNTLTALPSRTPTVTFTPTFTSTVTSTSTGTHSFTPTVTNTFTPTHTLTPVPTDSFTFTNTSTATHTPTNTSTFTNTWTPTHTFTPTNTLTAPPSSTPSGTNTPAPPTSTFTPPDTTTPAPPTSTFTSTNTGTATNSPTYTFTATNSFTFTNTSTATHTPTDTSTFTNTWTPTFTFTPTSTNTPAPPTATLTFTNTRTATHTPTNTSTSTNTWTPTFTFTATNTFTPTFTNTQAPPTATFTFTNTWTPTFTVTPTPTAYTSGSCAGATAWNGNFVAYAVGAKVIYNNELYQCIQAHTSEPNWMPPAVPALWNDLGPCTGVGGGSDPTNTPITSSGACSGVAAWNGNFTAYAVGAKVTYNNELYQCIQAHTSEPNWMPPAVPALWNDLGSCSGEVASNVQVNKLLVYPDPIQGTTTTLYYQIGGGNDSNSTVTLKIYSTSVRLIWSETLYGSAAGPGDHRVVWDLKDMSGIPLSNGVYYYTVTASGQNQKATKRIPLLILR